MLAKRLDWTVGHISFEELQRFHCPSLLERTVFSWVQLTLEIARSIDLEAVEYRDNRAFARAKVYLGKSPAVLEPSLVQLALCSRSFRSTTS